MKPTRDHQVIRQWANRHSAVPAEILPQRVDSEPAILTLLIGTRAAEDAEVKPISWELFFAKFDALELYFAYDDDRSSRFDLVRMDESPGSALTH